jgi:predicted DsbA family dithiol-disulfide isomerase
MTAPNIDVAPGTIAIFSNLACPFTHIAVHRLFTTRQRLGLTDAVRFDHHSFPIELLNGTPGTRHGSDSEIPALGHLEPDAGWQLWQRPDYEYPSTLLLAFEAVHAAKRQGLRPSEDLDRAMRRAFWADSATIQMHATILEIADHVVDLDAALLAQHITDGIGRRDLFGDLEMARTDTVTMSPHLFLPDGTNSTNPGLDVHWQGDWGKGFPVVDNDDPTVYDDLIRSAASTMNTADTDS